MGNLDVLALWPARMRWQRRGVDGRTGHREPGFAGRPVPVWALPEHALLQPPGPREAGPTVSPF